MYNMIITTDLWYYLGKSSNQKLKLLYIAQMFMESTDEENGITVKDIIAMLGANGIRAERKSIYNDIEALKSFGLDILPEKSKETHYHLVSRDFEIAELKLLVDSVQCSKFITEKKSMELIGKLERLASSHQASLLHRDVHVIDRIKRENESIYYNVDKLHEAIARKKRISFRYFKYNVRKEKVFGREGGTYIADPYGLSWSEENYYLITYNEKYNGITHYRVDRMTDIEVLDENRLILPDGKDFNIADYCKKVFNMFQGEDIKVKLRCYNELATSIFDRFGTDIIVAPEPGNTFIVTVDATNSRTFYGWLTQFGDQVEIVEPKDVAEDYKAHLKRIMKKY